MKKIVLFCSMMVFLCLSIQTTSAYYIKGKVYFDNTTAKWQDMRFSAGLSIHQSDTLGWGQMYALTPILGCDSVYYVDFPTQLDSCMGFMFNSINDHQFPLLTDADKTAHYFRAYYDSLNTGNSSTRFMTSSLNDDSLALCFRPTLNGDGDFDITAVPLKNLTLENCTDSIVSGTGTKTDPFVVIFDQTTHLKYRVHADYLDSTKTIGRKYTSYYAKAYGDYDFRYFYSNPPKYSTNLPEEYDTLSCTVYYTTNFAVTYTVQNRTSMSGNMTTSYMNQHEYTTYSTTTRINSDSRLQTCPDTLYYSYRSKPKVNNISYIFEENHFLTIGNNISAENDSITAWGVYYDTVPFSLDTLDRVPKICFHNQDYNESIVLRDLPKNTSYYCMSFAVNSLGTSYSDIDSCSTDNGIDLFASDTLTTPPNGKYASIYYSVTYTDLSHYYFISLPFLAQARITDSGANSVSFTMCDTSRFVVLPYHSEERAKGGDPYAKWPTTTLTDMQAGKGYVVGFSDTLTPPVTVIYYCQYIEYAIDSIDINDDDVNFHFTAQPSQTGNPDDSSWNITGTNKWTNARVIGPTVVAIPKESQLDYNYIVNDPAISASEIKPFTAFFMQYAGDVTMQVVSDSSVPGLRSTTPDTTESKAYYLLNLTNNSKTEQARAVVCCHENGSTGYEVGQDFPDLNGTASCGIYTSLNGHTLFYNSLPDSTITLGVSVNLMTSEAYTISLDSHLSNATHVWLTDKSLNKTVDLLYEDYTFTGTQGSLATRFELQIIRKDLPLKQDDISTSLEVYSHNNAIVIKGLETTSQVFIYNELGQLLERPLVQGSSLNLENMPQGIYLVKIVNKSFNQTFKVNLQ